jgi:hypothetical protein
MSRASGLRSNYLMSLACVEFEGTNSRGPIETAHSCVILVRVPKGAVITWINRHGTVVSPPMVGLELSTTAIDHHQWTEHHPGRISWSATSYVDARKQVLAGRAEAQRHVPDLIHGDTAKPVIRIWISNSSLLINEWGRRVAQFVPAHCTQSATFHSMVYYERLVISEITVSQSKHYTIA